MIPTRLGNLTSLFPHTSGIAQTDIVDMLDIVIDDETQLRSHGESGPYIVNQTNLRNCGTRAVRVDRQNYLTLSPIRAFNNLTNVLFQISKLSTIHKLPPIRTIDSG